MPPPRAARANGGLGLASASPGKIAQSKDPSRFRQSVNDVERGISGAFSAFRQRPSDIGMQYALFIVEGRWTKRP